MKTAKSGTNHRLIVARFDYQATEPHELTVSRGERLILLDSSREWWLVQNASNQSGYVPSNYVKRERQNLLTSIRSAFRDVLRRRESKDGFSRSFAGEPRYVAPRRSGKQQLTPTRSDPNLNAVSPLRAAPLNISPLHNGGQINRMDPRYASFSTPRAQPPIPVAPQRLPLRAGGAQMPGNKAKAYECESYPSGAFDMVPSSATPNGPIRYATVLYTYVAERFDELTLRKGDRVGVYEVCVDGWWRVQYVGTQADFATPSALSTSKLPLLTRIGWFPSNYLDLEGEEAEAEGESDVAFQSQLDSTNQNGNVVGYGDSLDNSTAANAVQRLWPEASTENSCDNSRFSAGNPLSSSRVEAATQDDNAARSADAEPAKISRVSLSSEKTSTAALTNTNANTADRNSTANASSNVNTNGNRDRRDSNTASTAETVIYNGRRRSSEVASRRQEPAGEADVKTAAAIGGDGVEGAEESEWYWAAARRVDCERALANASGGSFLVRDCESSPGDYTIVVRRDDALMLRERERDRDRPQYTSHCRNFRVHFITLASGPDNNTDASIGSRKRTGLFAIGTLKFVSLDALLSHYRRHPIFSNAHETLYLITPVRREKFALERNSGMGMEMGLRLAASENRPTKALSGLSFDTEMSRSTPLASDRFRASAAPTSASGLLQADAVRPASSFEKDQLTEQIYDSAFASSGLRFRDSIPRFNSEPADEGTDL